MSFPWKKIFSRTVYRRRADADETRFLSFVVLLTRYFTYEAIKAQILLLKITQHGLGELAPEIRNNIIFISYRILNV